MSTVRRVTAHAVKAMAATVDILHPPGPGIVVLLYHRVGTDGATEMDLPRERFAAQMAWLVEHRNPVSLDTALDLLAAGEAPPVAPVVVTFDDGTADFVDEALPILVHHAIPATVYVATDFVEQGRSFPLDGRPVSWSGLRDATATDLVTVGSHTHTHALLDRLPDGAIADELDRSVELIEDRVGRPARHFAYPKALEGSTSAHRAVKQRFRSAAVAGTRPNPYGTTDPRRLSRSPIQVTDGMGWFARKAAGGLALEDRLRTVANRRRYAGVTS